MLTAKADLEPWKRLGLPGGPRVTTQLHGNGEVTAAALILRGTSAAIVSGFWIPAHSQAAAAISTLWMNECLQTHGWIFRLLKNGAKTESSENAGKTLLDDEVSIHPGMCLYR